MAKLATGLVLSLVLLFNSTSLYAESGKIYNPGYRYSGPEGTSMADEDIKGKDPMLATVLAVLPGVVIHGFGNFYAEDFDFGTKMLITEIVGIGIWAWGTNVVNQPDNWIPYFGGSHEHTIEQAGYWITAAGVGLFALSWLGDLATAHKAAASFNREHSLQFQLDARLGAPTLSLTAHF